MLGDWKYKNIKNKIMSKTNEITEHEEKFCKYRLGMSGSFTKPLYDLMFRADPENQLKLISVFPELNIVPKYIFEEGYWADLIRRWNLKYPNYKLLE